MLGVFVLAFLTIGLAFVGAYAEVQSGESSGWTLLAFICFVICLIGAFSDPNKTGEQVSEVINSESKTTSERKDSSKAPGTESH